MQRAITRLAGLLGALTFLLSFGTLGCDGGGGSGSPEHANFNLAFEFTDIDALQTSPIVQLTFTFQKTGIDRPVNVALSPQYSLSTDDGQFHKMSAAPGSLDLNAAGTTISVPPDGTQVLFLWDAMKDLGPEAANVRVVARAFAGARDETLQATASTRCDAIFHANFQGADPCLTPPRFTSDRLTPDAAVLQAYSSALPVASVVAPSRFELVDPTTGLGRPDGELGNGLTLNLTTGAVTGIPLTPGTMTFVARVVQNCDPNTESVIFNCAPPGVKTEDAPNRLANPNVRDQRVIRGAVFDQERFTLIVTGEGTPSCANAVTMEGGSCPAGFTTCTLPAAVLNVAYAQTATVRINDAAIAGEDFTIESLAIEASELPEGIAVALEEFTSDSREIDAVVSGTATSLADVRTEPYGFTLTMQYTCGGDQFDASRRFEFRLSEFPQDCAPILILTSQLPAGQVGEPYTATLMASGGEGTLTWSIASGTLPTGLSLAPTGVISGTPTAAGSFDVVFQVVDQCANPSPQTLTIDIDVVITDCPPLAILSTSPLPTAVIGQPYSVQLTASGGSGTLTWGLAEGSAPLPNGLSLSASGLIAGTATGPAGTANFTVRVQDECASGAQVALQVLDLPVSDNCGAGPSITTLTLPPATNGQAYGPEQFTASGGVGPLSWAVSGGILPAGLSLTEAGLLSGTASDTPGDYPVTITVTDACADPGPRTDTQDYILSLSDAACGPAPVILTTTLPPATVGEPYVAVLEASGGDPPLEWNLAAGSSLPDGLLLAVDGTILGTPTGPSGTFSFDVTVTDACATPQTASGTITLDIIESCPTLAFITPSPLPDAPFNQPYSTLIETTGGCPPVTMVLASGALPKGLVLNPDGLVTGTPNNPADIGRTFTFVARATDVGIPIPPTGFVPPQSVDGEYQITVTGDVCPTIEITTTTLPAGLIGQPYSATLSATGGFGLLTWSLVDGSTLPDGLTLSPDGTISGVPTGPAGTVSFEVQVSDECATPQTVTASFTIDIVDDCPVLSFLTKSPLPDALFQSPYSVLLETTGGCAPITITLVGGSLPSGLTLDPSGLVIGTPDNAADIGQTFTFTAQATDSRVDGGPQVTEREYQLTVVGPDCPAIFRILTETLPDGRVGEFYSATIETEGGVEPLTFSITAGSLPDGLSLDSASGVISGVPTAAGRASVTIEAQDSCALGARTDLKVYDITIEERECADPPQITTETLPDATQGNGYALQLEAAGGDGELVWFEGAGSNLPANLGLSATGLISGVVTAPTGTYTVVVVVMDNCPLGPQQDTRTYTLIVNEPPDECPDVVITTTSLPDATIGQPYATTLIARGGTPPLTWVLSDGTQLPPGLLLGADGVILGTPTGPAGRLCFNVKVSDSCPTGAKVNVKQLCILVNEPPDECPAVGIATSTLPEATIGQGYSATLQAAGGTAPFSWVLSDGTSLPAGLTLSTGGTIAGTPTGPAGRICFNVKVTDSCPTGVKVFVKQLCITVNEPPDECPDVTIATDSLPSATIGRPYATTLAARGGTAPFTWVLADGTQLPAGLLLGADGVILGTPTGPAGRVCFNVKVTDSCPTGRKVNVKQLCITVNEPPDECPDLGIATSSLPDAILGESYSVTLQASGGVAPFTWQLADGTALPAGLVLTAAGVITGTPAGPTGQVCFNVRVKDECPTGKQTFTKQLCITVRVRDNCPALGIATTALPDAILGESYNATLQASGGTAPFTWQLANGTTLPNGLVLTADGLITGTANGPTGRVCFEVRVKDECPTGKKTFIKELCIVVRERCGDVGIATTSLPDATIGQSYATTLQASGGTPPFSWHLADGTDLPAGLLLGADGVILGTPTGPAGRVCFNVKVTDSCPTGAKVFVKQLCITVKEPPCPAVGIATSSLPDATIGTSYSTTLQASGGTAPFTWLLSDGTTLPAGLTLSQGGVISGTPTVPAGRVCFNVKVTDSCASGAKVFVKQLCITVKEPPVLCPDLGIATSTLQDATIGQAYSATLQAAGGIAPFFWSLAPGSVLPAGLSLSQSGVIAGTTTGPAGRLCFVVKVKDSCPTGQKIATKELCITVKEPPVQCPALAFAVTTLPEGTVGQSYSTRLNASGGVPPLFWQLISGSLPPGINLLADGTLSGTPTTPGEYCFRIRLKDSCPSQKQLVDKDFCIRIKEQCPALAWVTGEGLPDATLEQPYSKQLQVSGGTAPFTFTLIEGTLPQGLTLASDGKISGTPTNCEQAGVHIVKIKVTDSCKTGAKVLTREFFLLLVGECEQCEPIVVKTPIDGHTGTIGSPFSLQIVVNGGVPPYSFTKLDGSLPTGLTLSSSGLISGTPTNCEDIGKLKQITFKVTDSCKERGGPAIVTSSIKILVTGTDCPILKVNSIVLPQPVNGTPYSTQLSASGGFGTLTWRLTSGQLPDGLTLHSDGRITGTPSDDPGTYNFTAEVSDQCPCGAQKQTFTGQLVLKGAPCEPILIKTSSIGPTAVVGTPYSLQLVVNGGVPPYTFTKIDGTLPAGLTLSASGVISGTPSNCAEDGQLKQITYKVTDSCKGSGGPKTVTGTLKITVDAPNCPSLAIVKATPPQPVNGQPYSFQFTSTGGFGAKTWTLTGASDLPNGLTFTADGKITGTPNDVAGEYKIWVKVEDSCPCGKQTATKDFRLILKGGDDKCEPLAITTTSIPKICKGEYFEYQLQASGGEGTLTWSIVSGSLPSGITLTSGGKLKGTSTTKTTTFTVTIKVKDQCPEGQQSKTKTFTITVGHCDDDD